MPKKNKIVRKSTENVYDLILFLAKVFEYSNADNVAFCNFNSHLTAVSGLSDIKNSSLKFLI